MDYSELQTFVVTSETLNMTKAAELLYLTQPTISNRIKTLENELGFELLIRGQGQKQLSLTTKGHEFLSIAKELLIVYEDIDKVKKNISKSLRTSSIDSIGTNILPIICKRIIEKENINFTIHTHQTSEAFRQIENRKVDIAFVSENRSSHNVTSEPIFKQKYFVVKPNLNPGKIELIHPNELDPAYEIYQRWSNDFHQWHDKWWSKRSTHKIRVDSTAMLAQFLEKENFWAIIQGSDIDHLKKHLNFQIYELSDEPPPRISYLLTNKFVSTRTRELVDIFKQYLFDYINEETENISRI